MRRLDQRVVVFLVAISGAVAGGASAAATTTARQAPPSAGPTAALGRKAATNPYGRLFQPLPLRGSASPGTSQPPQPDLAPKPRVVCGMTVVPVDPGIDPGIAAPPTRSTARFTIRAIEPPVCR